MSIKILIPALSPTMTEGILQKWLVKVGDEVILKLEPAVQKGMYFPRFHGKQGTIAAKKGNCYEVNIKDFKTPYHVKLDDISILLKCDTDDNPPEHMYL